MPTITAFRDDRARPAATRHRPLPAGELPQVVRLPNGREVPPAPLLVALDRALARPLEPWWRHWLHLGNRQG